MTRFSMVSASVLAIIITCPLLGGCGIRSAVAQDVLRSLNNSETDHLPRLYRRRFFSNGKTREVRRSAPSRPQAVVRHQPKKLVPAKPTVVAVPQAVATKPAAAPVAVPAPVPKPAHVALAAPAHIVPPVPKPAPEPPSATKWGGHLKGMKNSPFSTLDVGAKCKLLVDADGSHAEVPVRVVAADVEQLKQLKELRQLPTSAAAKTYLVAMGEACDNLVNGTGGTARDYGVLWVTYNAKGDTFSLPAASEAGELKVVFQKDTAISSGGLPLYRLTKK